MNVLIPNIGRRGYLVRYLKQTESFSGKVFVSDCDSTASGLYGDNDGAFILPRPFDDEKNYIQQLISLCISKDIKAVIPVIDPEIFILSRNRNLLNGSGIFVSVSSDKVLDICYNKLLMNAFLCENGFLVPLTYNSIPDFETALKEGRIHFPVMIKPVYGSGSESTYKVNSQNEVHALFHDGMIIQEFIEGKEFGVDVFNDLSMNPVRCVVKRKISMRSGETDKAESVSNNPVKDLMVELAKKLGHICNLDSDVLEKDGKLYVIDLNPRFGGGYPATHESGVNLLELVIRLADGKAVEPVFDNYKTGRFTMKEIALVATDELIRRS